jgi:hypothetical protein
MRAGSRITLDVVTVTAHPRRDGRPAGAWVSITRAEGTVLALRPITVKGVVSTQYKLNRATAINGKRQRSPHEAHCRNWRPPHWLVRGSSRGYVGNGQPPKRALLIATEGTASTSGGYVDTLDLRWHPKAYRNDARAEAP